MGIFGSRKKKREPENRVNSPHPVSDDLLNYIIVILDSCRFDTFMEASPSTILKLGEVEQRYSYASWTAPSHYNLLMGLMPHTSPRNVFASEYYKKDFVRFNERLGAKGIEFKSLVPKLYLSDFLRSSLGYITRAMVSLPVLTAIHRSTADSIRGSSCRNITTWLRCSMKCLSVPTDHHSIF